MRVSMLQFCGEFFVVHLTLNGLFLVGLGECFCECHSFERHVTLSVVDTLYVQCPSFVSIFFFFWRF